MADLHSRVAAAAEDLARSDRFSGSVLVRLAGETILEMSRGYADRTSGRQNAAETAFQIASVSKQFTAAAILRLHERGRLALHDRIGRWLPDCPANWQPMTVHQLLTHTSGLAHWADYPELDLTAPIGRAGLIATFQGRPLRFPPGTGWAYSSPAYVLLAHIVEQIAGEPYAAFLESAFFRPLAMARTGAGNAAPQPARQAIGYSGGEPVRPFDLATVGVGAGDLWSTSGDLARWLTALTTGTALGARSLDAMFTPHVAVPNDELGLDGLAYGYGWYLARVAGHMGFFHPGGNAGFSACVAVLPDDAAQVIVLANDEQADAPAVGRRLVRALVEA